MSSPNPIPLSRPLRQVQLTTEAGPGSTADLERQALERERAAYAQGLADGERRLSEQLLRQRAELQALQAGVLASLRQTVPQVVEQTEKALIELALDVAQKLVADLPISAALIEANLRAALAQVEETTEFDIHLHPEDLALLQKADSAVLHPAPTQPPMHFLASPKVSRGGCLVQTRFGIIDARRETKMALLRKALNP